MVRARCKKACQSSRDEPPVALDSLIGEAILQKPSALKVGSG